MKPKNRRRLVKEEILVPISETASLEAQLGRDTTSLSLSFILFLSFSFSVLKPKA